MGGSAEVCRSRGNNWKPLVETSYTCCKTDSLPSCNAESLPSLPCSGCLQCACELLRFSCSQLVTEQLGPWAFNPIRSDTGVQKLMQTASFNPEKPRCSYASNSRRGTCDAMIWCFDGTQLIL